MFTLFKINTLKNKLRWLFLSLITIITIIFISLKPSPVFGQQQAQIEVDFANRQTGIHSMSGFLYGATVDNPPVSIIQPLQPNLWRTSWFNAYPKLTGLNAQFQLLLSDTWGYGKGNRPWPYQDYPAWEARVRKLAQQHKDKKIIWDVWNEPDLKDPFWNGTRKQFFETYKRAYTVLRQELGPTAMIGGPSITKYDKNFITEFLDYCKDNNLEVNFLSWHELNDNAISAITGHINDARKSYQQNPKYSSLKIQKLYVNEIIGPTAQYRPAEILGYLYYTERGKADGACKACWTPKAGGKNNCFNESLDGLVVPGQASPRAGWWVYKAYADGFNSRVFSRSNNPQVVALASQSDGTQQAQILLGYFQQNNSPGRSTVVLTLKNLQQLGYSQPGQPLTFTIKRIPNSEEKVIQQLDTLRQEQIAVTNETVRLTIPNIRLHEAYLLSIS
ncbi:MAG: beta-xylosidase [Microcoleaceae cyanobacterium]